MSGPADPKSERVIMREIQAAISRDGTRLFRNQVGEAWAGKSFHFDGKVVVQAPYRIAYGLHVGSGDLIGWTVYTIQPEDVGRKVAVFTSVEVKAPRGRANEDQVHWCATVNATGGIAVVARSVPEVRTVIEEYRPHE